MEFNEALGRVLNRWELKLADKRRQYGNSHKKVPALLKIFWPNGIPPRDYFKASIMVHLLDKQCRIVSGQLDDPEDQWGDILGHTACKLADDIVESQNDITKKHGLSKVPKKYPG